MEVICAEDKLKLSNKRKGRDRKKVLANCAISGPSLFRRISRTSCGNQLNGTCIAYPIVCENSKVSTYFSCKPPSTKLPNKRKLND